MKFEYPINENDTEPNESHDKWEDQNKMPVEMLSFVKKAFANPRRITPANNTMVNWAAENAARPALFRNSIPFRGMKRD